MKSFPPPHLRNPKVHYRVQKSPPLALILNKMNSPHNLTPCFSKIYTNIIFPSVRKSSAFPTIACMHFSSFPSVLHA